MVLKLYMDQHVPRAITSSLRSRGVDVLTAFEDGTSALADPALLDRSTFLGRVLFTRDNDLLAEASRRQTQGVPFCGVVYAHQRNVSIGHCIRDLEILMLAGVEDDIENKVTFLPL